MFEFPNPLTEQSLRDLMVDERYWKTGHPQHNAYARRVREGFEKLYGTGPASTDAAGRVIVTGTTAAVRTAD